jgi:hypothetical protein
VVDGFKFPLHTINKNILRLGFLGGKEGAVAPKERRVGEVWRYAYNT